MNLSIWAHPEYSFSNRSWLQSSLVVYLSQERIRYQVNHDGPISITSLSYEEGILSEAFMFPQLHLQVSQKTYISQVGDSLSKGERNAFLYTKKTGTVHCWQYFNKAILIFPEHMKTMQHFSSKRKIATIFISLVLTCSALEHMQNIHLSPEY